MAFHGVWWCLFPGCSWFSALCKGRCHDVTVVILGKLQNVQSLKAVFKAPRTGPHWWHQRGTLIERPQATTEKNRKESKIFEKRKTTETRTRSDNLRVPLLADLQPCLNIAAGLKPPLAEANNSGMPMCFTQADAVLHSIAISCWCLPPQNHRQSSFQNRDDPRNFRNIFLPKACAKPSEVTDPKIYYCDGWQKRWND